MTEDRLCAILLQHFGIGSVKASGSATQVQVSQIAAGEMRSSALPAGASINTFVPGTLALLELEREAEMKQVRQIKSPCHIRLRVTSNDACGSAWCASLMSMDCRPRQRLQMIGRQAQRAAAESYRTFGARMLRLGCWAGHFLL